MTAIVPAENKADLQKKIDVIATTVYEFSIQKKETEKLVKQQFAEVLDDARRLGLELEEVRRMMNEAFSAKGSKGRTISEGYLRELLPTEFKHTEFTRKTYILDQQVNAELSSNVARSIQKQVQEVAREVDDSQIQTLTQEKQQLQKEVETLRSKPISVKAATGEEIQTQPFEQRLICDVSGNQIPVKVGGTGINVKIDYVEVDKEIMRKAASEQYRKERALERQQLGKK